MQSLTTFPGGCETPSRIPSNLGLKDNKVKRIRRPVASAHYRQGPFQNNLFTALNKTIQVTRNNK